MNDNSDVFLLPSGTALIDQLADEAAHLIPERAVFIATGMRMFADFRTEEFWKM
jgi:hypothetical protein